MYVFELFQFKTRENVCEREGDKMWNELRTWWRDYIEHVKSQPKGDNLQNQGQLLVYTETKFVHRVSYQTTITFEQENLYDNEGF